MKTPAPVRHGQHAVGTVVGEFGSRESDVCRPVDSVVPFDAVHKVARVARGPKAGSDVNTGSRQHAPCFGKIGDAVHEAHLGRLAAVGLALRPLPLPVVRQATAATRGKRPGSRRGTDAPTRGNAGGTLGRGLRMYGLHEARRMDTDRVIADPRLARKPRDDLQRHAHNSPLADQVIESVRSQDGSRFLVGWESTPLPDGPANRRARDERPVASRGGRGATSPARRSVPDSPSRCAGRTTRKLSKDTVAALQRGG